MFLRHFIRVEIVFRDRDPVPGLGAFGLFRHRGRSRRFGLAPNLLRLAPAPLVFLGATRLFFLADAPRLGFESPRLFLGAAALGFLPFLRLALRRFLCALGGLARALRGERAGAAILLLGLNAALFLLALGEAFQIGKQ